MNNVSYPLQRPLARRVSATAAAAVVGLVISASGISASGAWAQAAGSDKPVAKVDDIVITETDVLIASEDLASSMPQGSTDAQKRDYIVGYLVDLKLGARAAAKAKIGDNATFEKRVAYFREKLLLDDYLNAEAKKSVTPEAMRKLYDESVKSLPPEEEVRARHILVDSKEKAREIYEKLAHGSDFAKLAKDFSKDPGSKDQGGELGFVGRGQMVPQFEEVAFKLQKGEVGEPFQTQLGWHVIRVDDRRQSAAPPFEAVKDRVVAALIHRKAQQIAGDLRGKAQIEYIDPEIKSSVDGERSGRPKQ